MVDPVSSNPPRTTDPTASPPAAPSQSKVARFKDAMVAANLSLPSTNGDDDGDTLEFAVRAPVFAGRPHHTKG